MPLWAYVGTLVLCCCGAFFCAGTETGFVSWNPIKVSHRAAAGQLSAKWALFLMSRKDRLLAAVLIGNNMCIIGATLAFLSFYQAVDRVFPLQLSVIRSPESWFLTPLLVIFGEMIPKSLFRVYSFRLTMRAVPLLMILYVVTLPFTWLYGIAIGLLRSSHGGEQSFAAKVREEMVLVASEGVRRGTLFESARDLIDSVLRLEDKTVADIAARASMPGLAHKAVFITDSVGDSYAKLGLVQADELAVYHQHTNEIAGTVRTIDLIKAAPATPLKTIMRPLPEVNSSRSLLSCLQGKDVQAHRFMRVIGHQGQTVGTLDRAVFFKKAFCGTTAPSSWD